MNDRQGKAIAVGDLVMVWQPSYKRWVAGRVSEVFWRENSVNVRVNNMGATISPEVSDVIVILDPDAKERKLSKQ